MKKLLIAYTLIMTGVVIKQGIDIYYLTRFCEDILEHLKQQEVDAVFADIVDRNDLDDLGDSQE